VVEGEGKKTSAGKIKSSEQCSNLRAAKFFVVVPTTFVLKYESGEFFFPEVILLQAWARNLAIQQEGRMEQGRLAFTAVYLKSNHGYIGFIEELPGVNSHGRTLDEARETLQKLAAVVFDEERREAEEMIAGKDVVRENFVVPIPRTL
jgi:predicted RNase H-like HicB family nuclease